jgi:hypothetical protein
MSTLQTLHDAFGELERRADLTSAASAADDAGGSAPVRALHRHRPARRWLAPTASVAAVAAVALTAVGIAAWRSGDGSGSPAAGPGASTSAAVTPSQPVTSSAVPPSAVTSSAVTPSSPPGNSAAIGPTPWQPPSTPAQVAATARAILAGIATITVTDTGYPVTQLVPGVRGQGDQESNGMVSATGNGASDEAGDGGNAGAAIFGVLTADGRSGGYDLNVLSVPQPSKGASCDPSARCTVSTRPDGSSLAISHWSDPSVPGGVTYQVELVRPDGADILLHLSTENHPKGQGTVTASRLPLTVAQMTDFVTSTRW